MQPVIENAANTARFVAVRQEEIFVAPLLEALIIDDILVLFANEAERFVKGERIGVFLCAAAVENGRQVRPAREPLAV